MRSYYAWFCAYCGRSFKSYSEYVTRLDLFRESYERILEHNSQNPSYRFRLTHYADVTEQELIIMRGFNPNLDENFLNEQTYFGLS